MPRGFCFAFGKPLLSLTSVKLTGGRKQSASRRLKTLSGAVRVCRLSGETTSYGGRGRESGLSRWILNKLLGRANEGNANENLLAFSFSLERLDCVSRHIFSPSTQSIVALFVAKYLARKLGVRCRGNSGGAQISHLRHTSGIDVLIASNSHSPTSSIRGKREGTLSWPSRPRAEVSCQRFPIRRPQCSQLALNQAATAGMHSKRRPQAHLSPRGQSQ